MWLKLSYRCDACHAFTSLDARLVHPGICARCGRPLDVRGHSHPVHGTEAGEAIRDSPVPVVLVFASGWKEAKAEEHAAVEALARGMSGEVTVLVTDLSDDFQARSVYEAQGRPRAVLLSGGNEIGRGHGYPRESVVRNVLTAALPHPVEKAAAGPRLAASA